MFRKISSFKYNYNKNIDGDKCNLFLNKPNLKNNKRMQQEKLKSFHRFYFVCTFQ